MFKYFKVRVRVPDGATHFAGNLTYLENVDWYKKTVVNGQPHWWRWSSVGDWVLESQQENPPYLEAIADHEC